MTELRIQAASRAAIEAHAAACYPHEACGFVVERDGVEEVVCVTNIQNERHAADPSLRDARTAYTMGKEAVPILTGHARGDLVIRAIFHSHPDHDAYFSAEDRKQATVWDEPSYPDAGQIVISVREGVAKAAKAFAWDAAARDYVDVQLVVD
ncbi:MAG TPA: Mov34/MPN/PAD-1 family protein [Candidatus Kryptonia bacterium]|nr:Mov34/MPN/PAD-1 family protein [Candidatus Kryptonia bacterium]